VKNDRSHTWVSQLFDLRLANNHLGFTLFELLISIAILAMIMIGLQQVIAVSLSAYKSSRDSGYLLSRARFAMERMVMFASETDYIFFPTSSSPMTQLQISERLLDTYDNATLIYTADGDGYLDADIDSDGTVNEESGPPPENEVKFSLDTTDPNNWKLTEKLPDYSTSNPSDSLSSRVICEHVTAFNCRLLSANLVEIALNLQDDNGSVSLKTRVIAGNLYLDVTPPIPNPMTWAGSPAAPGPNSITMTATTASDESGVEYYFECTAGGGHDSNWQDSPAYEDTGLVAGPEVLWSGYRLDHERDRHQYRRCHRIR
jgi:prepilin-type N-terminal cleavage/methylation domain-containing protein